MPRPRLALVALISMTVLSGAREPAESIVDNPIGLRIDQALQRATGGAYWGAALVAVDGKVVLAKGYGYADYGTTSNRPETLFEIASTSKPITAAAILKLRMQGKLALDDTLNKFFPDVPTSHRAITVQHLLTHTSGMSGRVGIPYRAPHTRAQAVAAFLSKPLASEVGTKFEYCNAAYSMLAAIIEIASKMSFEAYVRKHLFEPSGMKATGFVNDKTLAGRPVSSRLTREGTLDRTAVDWNWSWGYRGMGGVVSTVYDLFAWDRALRGDSLFDAESKRLMATPTDASDGYACGWRISTAANGAQRLSHSGGVSGYACNYVRYVDRDVVIVLLSNGRTNIHQLTKTIEEALFPPPRVTLAVDTGPFELTKFKGVEIQGPRWAVRKRDGGIELQVKDARRNHVLVSMKLPTEARKALVESLRRYRGRIGANAKGSVAGVYLGPYTLKGTRLQVNDGLSVQVMPMYRGMGADRKPIVDRRVTFILTDRLRRQWPFMAKLDRAAVDALLQALLGNSAKAR